MFVLRQTRCSTSYKLFHKQVFNFATPTKYYTFTVQMSSVAIHSEVLKCLCCFVLFPSQKSRCCVCLSLESLKCNFSQKSKTEPVNVSPIMCVCSHQVSFENADRVFEFAQFAPLINSDYERERPTERAAREDASQGIVLTLTFVFLFLTANMSVLRSAPPRDCHWLLHASFWLRTRATDGARCPGRCLARYCIVADICIFAVWSCNNEN